MLKLLKHMAGATKFIFLKGLSVLGDNSRQKPGVRIFHDGSQEKFLM